MTGLGLETEHRNYSMNNAQAPLYSRETLGSKANGSLSKLKQENLYASPNPPALAHRGSKVVCQ